MKKVFGLLLSVLVGCTTADPHGSSQAGLSSGATYSGATYGGATYGDPPGDGDPLPGDGGTCPDGTCTDPECDEFWSFPSVEAPPPPPVPVPTPTPIDDAPAPAAAGAIRIQSEQLTAEVTKEGVIIVRDGAGRVVETLRGVLAKLPGGGWMIRQTPGSPVPEILKRVKFWNVAKCVGVISTLLLLSELSYAGMEAALGPAAAQMGIRQVDCQERFGRAVGGIQCLLRQGSQTTCAQAVTSCPDAFFGANLVQSCGTEPGMNELVDALVAAIQNTSVLSGGRGYITPDPAGQIAAAIRQGTIATSPEMTCTLRTVTQGCQFLQGSIFGPPAGWSEAKACWEGASRGILESKYQQAQRCCNGAAACLAQLTPMQNC